MNSCDYNSALYTIQLLREQYRANPHPDIVKDVVYIVYENSEYKLYLALVDANEKAITMEWLIEMPFTIPKEIRDYARENSKNLVILDEYLW